MLLHISSFGFRLYLGLFLLNSISVVTHGTALNLRCTNDFDLLMFCQFLPPSNARNCSEYYLNTTVEGSQRYTERDCNLTRDSDPTWTCSCSMNMEGLFLLSDIHNTTLWKAGDLVESKNISVFKNRKPKAPKVTSVRRENGDYRVEWDTNYKEPIYNMTAVVTYRRPGEEGTEVNVSSGTLYCILEFLQPSTDYVVNVRSVLSFDSESSDDFPFTTPVSSDTILVVIILSLSVAAVIITSFLLHLITRLKTKLWYNVGKYKNSTLLDMVPVEPKVLMPQNPALCSVYVDSPKEVKDDTITCSPWVYSHQSSRADCVSSSLGNSQKVSADIVSSMEDAMRKALPEVSLPSTTAPWLFMGHSNLGYNPVPGTSTLGFFEILNYSMAPPFRTQGLNGALPAVLSESLLNPSMLRDASYDPSPDFQVPIFQLTRQRQPLVIRQDSSYMKRDHSMSSFPTDGLQVDLEYSPSRSEATSTSILCGVGSSLSSVCSTGALRRETLNASHLGRAASLMEHVYGQEEPSVKVCGSNLCEEPRPAPACSLVPGDDDYQAFQSVVRGHGELIPEASEGRPSNWPDKLSETFFTAMPSMVNPLATSNQGAKGFLESQANKVSVLLADEHKLVIIGDYHSV
ncbi:uncharacterized protein LOC130379177 isoform X1 [Gadus chalcogrammus]|uniref:uncharacterized protein LOC130379177 isoform X1 n=2 Tax=Gadus chalcogrammus TaxID=1042646 RepID=UPI0024C33900|nr:uncharacterized protein LOC130379177 isoform X1 [Gadus chalcogrammus]